jgi:hypothetical protein
MIGKQSTHEGINYPCTMPKRYHRYCLDETCVCGCHKNRVCYACGTDKTFIDKRYNREYWIRNNDKENNVLCSKCYAKYFTGPKYGPALHKKWDRIYSGRVLSYKGSNKLLKENPKTGKCSKCGRIKGIDCKRTSIHHEQYHDDELLKDTYELCNSCHMKMTWKLGQMKCHKQKKK